MRSLGLVLLVCGSATLVAQDPTQQILLQQQITQQQIQQQQTELINQ